MLSSSATEKAFESGVAAVASPRDVVIIDGPEAAGYLQGQLSQNVERLDLGQSAWSLLLDPQGRIDAWLRVTRRSAEVFWLDVDPGYGEQTLARLERFKLRTKFEGSLIAGQVVAIRGPQTPDLATVMSALDGVDAVAVTLEWPGADGIDVISPDPLPAQVLSDLGIDLGPPEALERLRIQLGIPAMGAELGEKTIPAEAGIVDRSADFTKGCYVGQELVARVDSRGNNTPRRVLPMRIDGTTAPAVGAEVLVDGEAAGVITSAAAGSSDVIALASIKRGVEVPSEATVQIDDQTVAARIDERSWE